MAKAKTIPTTSSIEDFTLSFPEEERQKDILELIKTFSTATSFEPVMWGPSIIGFGSYHYKYESGHEGDAPLTAFSPRKTSFALYLSGNLPGRNELLEKLGKYKLSGSCIHIKKTGDIDLAILKKMIIASVKHIKTLYKTPG